MTQKLFFICVLLTGFCFVATFSDSAGHAATKELTPGTSLPKFTVTPYDSHEAKDCLGVQKASFSLSEVPCKIIILEIFSLYCPICHKQAPVINKVYKFIQHDPDLRETVKVIGIGAGNNPREIASYKGALKVPFPLVPDPDFSIYKKLGEPRTPTTLVVSQKGTVLFSHSGLIDNEEMFLQKVKQLSQAQ